MRRIFIISTIITNLIVVNELILFILIYPIICSSKDIKFKYLNLVSEITLTINGTKAKSILSIYSGNYIPGGPEISFKFIPNKIFINDELQNYTGHDIKYLNRNINKVRLEWEDQINNTNVMFKDLNNIIDIDLSKFDASKVTNMVGMFDGCTNLLSINFKNFNTSSIRNMYRMFKNCKSLISLDLNSFDTSLVTDMTEMFMDCNSLVTLKINTFNISSVFKLDYLFYHCDNLISLDLSNFDASQVTSMNYMFSYCKKLIFINFYNCTFKSSGGTFTNMFQECNATICFNNDFQTLQNNDLKIILKNQINNCLHSCFMKDKKIISKSKDCINDCSYTENYKYEYNNICYSSCPYGTNSSSNNKYLCVELTSEEPIENYDTKTDHYENVSTTENILLEYNETCETKCKNCSKESSEMHLCISCNTDYNYYPKLNDSFNKLSFINCYNTKPNGHFLDNNEKIYKPCYYKCETCEEKGSDINNKCLSCKAGYIFKDDFINDTNCYENCDFYYYFDSDGKYHCTYNNSCPKDYNILIEGKNRCIKYFTEETIYKYEENFTNYIKFSNYIINYTESFSIQKEEVECSNEYPYIKNGECLKECISVDLFNNNCKINDKYNKIDDELLNRIKKDLSNGKLDSLLLNLTNGEKNSLVFNQSNVLYQITTSDEQKKNSYENISRLLLGDCENTLKTHYNISMNQTLLILKIDSFKEGSLIPIIEYEVYHPINKTKLDLKYCNDTLINLNIPVEIDENNIFKYDPTNDFYTDECNSYTNEHGTDILLNDRHDEYNNNNLSICENKCKIKEYSTSDKSVVCECEIKYITSEISETMNNEVDSLNYNFKSKNLSSNMVSMKCYYTLFTKDGIYKNIANYILLFFIVFFIASGILFYKIGYPLLEDDIQSIICLEGENKKGLNNNETIDINFKDKSNKILKKKKKKSKHLKINKKEKDSKTYSKTLIKKNHSKDKSNSRIKIKSNKNVIVSKKDKNIKNNEPKNIYYHDYELNSCLYQSALKYDKRSIGTYYISLIKTKHPVIFSVCPIKDYNSKIIKIDLFFLSFSEYYFFNALFFNEKVIHKIYEEQGIYNFIYLIPFILYSFIISDILIIIIKYFSLSERNICEINFVNKKEKSNKAYKVKKILVIKYLIFFGAGLVFLLFLWYYLSSFGAVYQNTQVYLIKNTMISFAFSLIYPFIAYIFVAIIRIYSLKDTNRECIYKLSIIIQYI